MAQRLSYFADNDWNGLRRALKKLAHNYLGPDSDVIFNSLQLNGLTASRLIWTNSSKVLASKDLVDLVAGTANEITITDDAAGGITVSIPSGAVITLANTGLHILDTNASHDLIISSGSDLTADRTLTLTTGDSDRTITLSGNPTLSDWFDQSVKTSASPTFAGLTKVGGASNYMSVESDGTVVFNGDATVWKDINLGAALLSKPASSAPDTDEFKDNTGTDTGIETYAFAVGEKVSGNFELQHDYKEGSNITFHIHWQGIDAPTGTDKVQWQLIYTVAQAGNTLNATTTITAEQDYDTQYEFLITSFAAITGTNFNIGDQFMFQLSRIAASADEYAGDALIATVGLHYEVDTVGSRQITTK